MILFYGLSDDTPLRRCLDLAADLGIDHRFLDESQLRFHDLEVELGPHGIRGTLILSGEHIDLETVSAVYARPLELPAGHDGRKEQTFHETFVEWLDYADAVVVNRPAAMHSNTSKPYQAQLIANAGFLVPNTLVTDDPEAVRDFWARHGRVVFKSVSGIRSIVTELDERTARGLHRVRSLPTQFQEYVPGIDIRVHVAGETVFPTAIASDATDYRYARQDGMSAELTATELPEVVSKSCVDLAERLGLGLCGIDLRRRPDGEYVCFEINPMPAYSYYEAETGQPISRSLVQLLTAE